MADNTMMDGIKRQLRSVIKWSDPDPGILFERWTKNGDEIKNASKLLVGPGQGCLFVYQGKVEAVITEEGMTDLETDNIPFWTTVTKVMQAFESEHRVGIYYFRQTEMLNSKWGTPAVIKYLDPLYKFPVGLRAFGNYSFKISEARTFFTNIVGGKESYAADDIREVISSRLSQPLTDYLAESKHTYSEIDAMREEIAAGVITKVRSIFDDLGFQLTDFRVEGTSFDEDTMNRINRVADMQAEAQAAQAVGLNYTQMEQLAALRDAAKNEGGVAGMGVGLGAGVGLGGVMSGAFSQNLPGASPGGGGQPTQPPAVNNPMAKLKKLKEMFEMELISQAEYEVKKKEILDSM